MYKITDVVKHLIIINVLMFIGSGALLPNSWNILCMYFPQSDFFKPYQIVTHMFMHADLSHIAMNMLMLYFLGPTVERYIKPKKFLILYLLSGLGALLAHVGVWYLTFRGASDFAFQGAMMDPGRFVLGASGAVFGVSVAFATLFPNQELMLIFPPIPIKAKYLISGFIVLDLFLGLTGRQTGVAHFAHLGGALVGFILILYWKKFK